MSTAGPGWPGPAGLRAGNGAGGGYCGATPPGHGRSRGPGPGRTGPRGRRQEQGSRAGETGHLVDEAGVGVGDAEGAGEDASSGIARDDRRASTGDLPATLGGEAGKAGVVRAAELRDAALGVDAAAL